MANLRRSLFLDTLKLFDLIVMSLAFLLASYAVVYQAHTTSLFALLAVRVKITNAAIFSGFLLSWHLLFRACGLYDSRRLASRKSDVQAIFKATTLGSFILLVASIIFHIGLIKLLFVVFFWTAGTALTLAGRLSLRFFLENARRRGRNLRYLLIVGTNSRALQFAKKLGDSPELGYVVIGFVDREWPGIEALSERGYTRLSDLTGFPEVLRANIVDEVVIALPFRSMHHEATNVVAHCEEQGIRVRVLTNLFDSKSLDGLSSELDEHTFVTNENNRFQGWPVLGKTAIDLFVAALALAILGPFLLVIAIIVKLSSPGPVFFVQKRLGVSKRPFDIYKVRTMIVNAEEQLAEIQYLNEVSGPVFKIRNDPRLTRVGRFLRKTSLDELPQLFNVLKGDMSLVGPVRFQCMTITVLVKIGSAGGSVSSPE